MLRLLIYFLIFASGVLLGSALPSYSLQYHQRLQSRFEQVLIDLKPFQDIADRFHGGSLDALIEHHLESEDPTFYAEGQAIRLMLQSMDELGEATAALNATPLSQVRFFVRKADYDTAIATLRHYQPSILLTSEAMRFSVAVGALLCFFSYFFWRMIRFFMSRIYRVT